MDCLAQAFSLLPSLFLPLPRLTLPQSMIVDKSNQFVKQVLKPVNK
jgi:hypothetical protein